ncbi:tweety protein [Faecalicatena fissicatena]|uniref:Tweety protein n=3 Tax=Lachnospiraceae TaxID=186803 RepID=A0A3R6E0C5_9FIRM|nr:tweety protein [Faecalicatena fissicatena]NSG28684.1 tweety protein [Faecalicatena fissicatena]RHA46020.1 tweety protein [Blautia obeum]RHG22962.1 tweety protein [Roseburia intestinalis]
MNLCFVFCHRQLSSIHENSQTEGVGNEVRQRASKDLANNLNLAMVTIYTFLLFFCCFGCYRGEKPIVSGFSPATGSATG